jgi:hypothetical protein
VNALELACLAVVVLWVALRLRGEPDPRGLAVRALVVAVSAFFSEDTCIRLYGFYFYARDRWTIFVDQVPLLVLIIWPIVILSSIDLLRVSRLPAARWPIALLALVVADAWFIEPAAVDAGLWTWTSPGPFSVPVVGVLGWGFFACGLGVVERHRWPTWSALLVAPVVCHALLLVTWWGALRWLPPPSPALLVVLVWPASAAVVVAVWRGRPVGQRPGVVLRGPAALFFFALLAQNADVADLDDPWLWAWCAAFAPPWLTLIARSRPMGARGT